MKNKHGESLQNNSVVMCMQPFRYSELMRYQTSNF